MTPIMRQATQGPTMEGPTGTTTAQRRSQQRVEEGETKDTDSRELDIRVGNQWKSDFLMGSTHLRKDLDGEDSTHKFH